MTFYQLLTIFCIAALPFFSVQIDDRINYVIYGFAFLILPLSAKNLTENLRRKNIVTIFFLLFLLSGALSTVFSIDQKRSLLQLMLYFSYFVIFTGIRSIFPTLRSKELLTFFFLLLTSILSVISLYQTVILKYVNRASEGVSFMWVYFGHNHLSALLIFAFPMSLYFLKKYWHKKPGPVLLLTACFLLLTLFLTFSRGSLISLISACAFSILFFRFIQKQRVPFFFIIGSFILLLSFITIISKQVGVTKPDALSPVRLVYWKAAIVNGLSHPITGTGLDTFRHISYDAQSRVLKTNYAHNFFLQILSDTGIFGFLTSIGLIGSVLWESARRVFEIRNSQKALLLAFWVGLLASTLNTMVDFDWQLSTVFLTYWIIAGMF